MQAQMDMEAEWGLSSIKKAVSGVKKKATNAAKKGMRKVKGQAKRGMKKIRKQAQGKLNEAQGQL